MVFGQLSKRLGIGKEYIFLGAPEAEAEALPNSKMPLSAVYNDYNELIPSLSHEKFVVVGRKGSGKSAFAEHVSELSSSDANLFAKFIRQSESNLEHIVQIGKDSNHHVERENLYTWLILTNILKLFSDNQSLQDNKDYNLLKQFLIKNSGYIDIRKSEIKELVEKQGFEISIEYLKRFFTSKMHKSIEIKQQKAPFYKLIPHLREVLVKVLTSTNESDNKNSYVLFFDDLDIAFSANDSESVDSMVSLLRVSKEINNELFSKNKLDSKVVILLRDDISKSLSSVSSDTAKIFSSYAVYINWYQDEYHGHGDEKKLHIRRFINDRIRYAFNESGFELNDIDPWKSLVEDPFQGITNNKTSFKYILDHTLFRPRDLLLLFKPLSSHKYKLPLDKSDVNHLIGRYCEELIAELKNELSCFYSSIQIETIFNAFGEISSKCSHSESNGISSVEAISIINSNCSDVNAKSLLEDMYARSLIGNIANNGYIYFKHREPLTDKYVYNKSYKVMLHSALKVYCSNKGYA